MRAAFHDESALAEKLRTLTVSTISLLRTRRSHDGKVKLVVTPYLAGMFPIVRMVKHHPARDGYPDGCTPVLRLNSSSTLPLISSSTSNWL
jgi:hypothetical protein